ncbi:MAG: 16S rRNA (cytidine(1402)-2'-O)-methyltransferase [Ruminococcaceae bacterium]|nr:16S rRNA (cytidine(1402)-2'-O)-methyltransferase [Oscillospiraceae bacterium]
MTDKAMELLPEDISDSLEILKDKEVYVTGGTLYVVATPIGRIVDISVRAIKVLEGVDLIAAEDTRRSYILLNILGIRKEVISNQKFNEHRKTERFLQDLRDGKSIAVISDAGTPCISDPGNELIKRAVEEGFPVVPVPGACAAVSGISVSGFDLTSFLFCGFFPKDNTDRKKELERLESGVTRTYIYYESPKRILKTMAFLAEKLPEARVCLCNDLTKTHERFYRGSAKEVLDELEVNPNAEKGEFTLIVEAPEKKEDATDALPPTSPHAALIDAMIGGAETLRDAIEAVLAEGNSPFKKNELKEAAIAIKSLFKE